MPKSTFIPAADHDFLLWFEHFIAKLTPDYGTTETDLAALKAASADFHTKTAQAGDAAAAAKQATKDKSDSRANADAADSRRYS